MDNAPTSPDHHPRHPLLHRLLLDAPAGPPPPMPMVGAPFTLRLADPAPDSADGDLVAGWMARPHLAETWEQVWPPDRWRADWDAKSESGYALPILVDFEGSPAAYVEIYRPNRDEIGLCYKSGPGDLGFHIAVADRELIGRGIFSGFTARLTTALLAADPGCDLLIIEPDHRNRRAHAAARKTGWIDCGEVQQRPDRRVRLFMYPAVGVDPRGRILADRILDPAAPGSRRGGSR